MDRIEVSVDQPGDHDPLRYCRLLEEGNILYFPETPFPFPREDRDTFLRFRLSTERYHKNIAYRPALHRVSGVSRVGRKERERLLDIMGGYSKRALEFLSRLLSPYASTWKVDYASFRPQEEEGRSLKLNARNDLLHVDSFPTRPTYGDRILRLFTNIHPQRARQWVTTDTFDLLLERFRDTPGLRLPRPARPSPLARLWRRTLKLGKSAGLPLVLRSPYDDFMLHFHDFLKEHREFQSSCRKWNWSFPPGSTWIVFTDLVPHAVLSGQFALEQTVIVSRHALLLPEKAPVRLLEKICGSPLGGSD